MWAEIPSALAAIASAASSGKAWSGVLRKRKGDTRALLEEMKNNYRLCNLVRQDDAAPEQVIPDLSTETYDRLALAGYNFNAVKRSRIAKYDDLLKTDLAAWRGRQSEELIENIYDKIKDLKALHKYAQSNSRRRWAVRLANVQKRILLLLRHLGA